MLLQIPIEDEDTLCTFAMLMRHPRAALCSLRAPETGELDDWDGRTFSTPKLLNFLGALPKFSQSLLLRSRRDGSPPLLPPLCLDSVEDLKDRLVANAGPIAARFSRELCVIRARRRAVAVVVLDFGLRLIVRLRYWLGFHERIRERGGT